MSSNLDNSVSQRQRKASTSRFEVEKVGEDELNASIKAIDNMNDSFENKKAKEAAAAGTSQSEQQNAAHHSNLKKTVKHFIYDDDFFDLNSGQNTATDKKTYLQTQSSYEKQPLTVAKAIVDDTNEEDEEKKENASVSCFQINYNEKNDPTSVTCNLNSAGVNSYKNCVHDFKTIFFYQKLIAEFTGTMLLTLYACSIGIPFDGVAVPSINGCLGGGLTLATLIWTMGNVSGGHFNPAVTIAFLFTGKINPLMTIMYVGSQLVGAISGSYILKSVAPEKGNLTVTDVHPDIHLDQAFGVEVIITFVLVFTIFSCVDTRRKDLNGSFPLQIGLAVAVGGLFGGKFTGGSMNPARSFGPAVTTGLWNNHWLYWLGPITGSLLAAFIYQFALRLTCPRPPPYRRVNTEDNA